MNISEISIRRPVFAWMLMASLILFGYISFREMGVSQLPDVDFPVVSISVTLEGAAPEVIEKDVIDPIEDGLMTVQGVRQVSSSARSGSASISVEFDLSKNIDIALQEVQNKVSQVQRVLPKDIDPPVFNKTNPEDQPILWLSVLSKDMAPKDLMAFTRDHLKDQFSSIPGVGDINLGGYIDPNLRVWVSGSKLNQYSLTVGDVVQAIQNEHSELPSGRIETSQREFNVRTMGEASSVDEFTNIMINARGGGPNYAPISIGQVATVEEGLADVRRISRTNGLPAVGLGIRKQRGSNAVEVAHLVKKKMEQINKTLPPGMELGVNFDSTRFIEDSVGELNFTLILSALLTSVVCWIFLGSFSSTMNVLLAIPTSIVGAFTILYFMGFTLNTFTLLGLSLAIGIVVDDAIMVLENIVRYREKGLSRLQAALTGSKEITFAAIAATVAIIAIFLPVAFMKGVIGKFFFQFGVTMTVAVALSLLEALTLTPMRCSQFLDVGHRTTRFGRGLENMLHGLAGKYQRVLEWCLSHRWTVLFIALIVFLSSFVSVKYLNKEFVPAQDQGVFMVRVQTPVGSSISFTDEKFKEVESFLKTRSEIGRFFIAVGGFGGGEVNTGIVFITMKNMGERGINPETKKQFTQEDSMAACRAAVNKIPNLKGFVQDLSMRGFTSSRGYPVEFTIRGPEWEVLSAKLPKIIEGMKESGLATDIDSDYVLGMPEVQVHPDRKKAALRGVSIKTIGETINAMVGGQVVGKYTKGGRRNDIRVRLVADERQKGDQIYNLFVRNNRGELIRLSEVVNIQEKPTLQQITRKDRERAITVYGNVVKGKSQSEAMEVAQKIAEAQMPSGYRAVMSGSAQSYQESFQGLLFALVLGLAVSYMILASQFNSFIDPVTVLMALPFSLSGAFLFLLIAKQSLNIYSFIGLILLMGIVKKNSILLVDFTNQVRERGEKDVRKALLEACPLRLRPILMTSIATIAGAIPPALAIGPGAETRIPMAVGVIGGVLVSTILTLFVVPCVYSLFSRFERRTFGNAENTKG